MDDPKRPPHDPNAPAPKAPTLGCIMFALILAFFTGALVFAVVQGFKMYEEIVAFTDEEPAEIPVERGSPEELQAIRARIAEFVEAVKPKEPPLAELTLDARELNMLIANDNYLTDIRGRFYIDSIGDDGIIRTQASRPRRHLVFWKPQRYLNGEIDIRVEAAERKFFLRVADVRIEGKTIDQSLLEYMRNEDLLEMYKNDDAFMAIVEKISSARVEDGKLTVSTAVLEEEPPTEPSS